MSGAAGSPRARSTSRRTPEAVAALGRVGLAAVPRGARDVHVGPRRVADEPLEELGAVIEPPCAPRRRWSRSAYWPFVSSKYSGWSGRRQPSSPVAAGGLDLGAQSSSLEKQAREVEPRATMIAPVSVARSTIRSAPCSTA